MLISISVPVLSRTLMHLARICAVCLAAVVLHATERASSADADYEAYQAASQAWSKAAGALNEGPIQSKYERLWAMEKAAFAEQAAALSFIEKYPSDPRRWIVVSKLTSWRPRYVKDWGTLDKDGRAGESIVIDTAAADAWKAKVAGLKQRMAEATDIPPELTQQWAARVAAADEAEAAQREFDAKWGARPLAPDFVVVDPAGTKIKLSDYKGKVVVLDFWATWCGPCLAAMPHNEEVAGKYKDAGVVILCVCTQDTREKFDAWVKKNGTIYPNLVWAFDPSGKKGISSELYQAAALPTQFVIDRNGAVTGTVTGYLEGEVILEAKLFEAGVPVDPAVRNQGLQQLEARKAGEQARDRPIEDLKKLLEK